MSRARTLGPALVVALGLVLLGPAGCRRLLGPREAPIAIPPYPDGAEGLKAFFTDVLEAARRDERERVHALFASLILTDLELARLFGPRAPELGGPYREMMGTLANRGAVELVAQVYEHKVDTVEVLPTDRSDRDLRPADLAVLDALAAPVAVYSVRVRNAAGTYVLRYSFFVYLDGHWRTGNQLGKRLAAERDGGVPPPPVPERGASHAGGPPGPVPDGGAAGGGPRP